MVRHLVLACLLLHTTFAADSCPDGYEWCDPTNDKHCVDDHAELPTDGLLHYYFKDGRWTDEMNPQSYYMSKDDPSGTLKGSFAQAQDGSTKDFTTWVVPAASKFNPNKANVPNGPFTICTVARYTDGANKRIFTSLEHNTLVGHYAGMVGIVHLGNDGRWVSKGRVTLTLTNWIWTCVSSKQDGSIPEQWEVRVNGLFNAQTTTAVPAVNASFAIGVNLWDTEMSDCEVGPLIIWNKALSRTELDRVEHYMHANYVGVENGLCKPLPPPARGIYLAATSGALFPLLCTAVVLGLALPKSEKPSINGFATNALGWAEGNSLPWSRFGLLFGVYGAVIAVGGTVLAYDQAPEDWQIALISVVAVAIPSTLLLCALVACFTPNARLRVFLAGTVYYTAASRLRHVWGGALVVVLSLVTLVVGGALYVEALETASIVCFVVGGVGMLGYAVMALRNMQQDPPAAGPWFAPSRTWLWGPPTNEPVAATLRPTPSVFKHA